MVIRENTYPGWDREFPGTPSRVIEGRNSATSGILAPFFIEKDSPVQIELISDPGQESSGDTEGLLREIVAKLCSDMEIDLVRVIRSSAGEPLPSGNPPEGIPLPGNRLRIDGVEISPTGPEGEYEKWALEAAVLRALGPRRFLFLCVANSARSQIAEGIARSIAPDGIDVASAGSRPSAVRPEAIAVLLESGIDISRYQSTSVDDVDPASIDAVITLCAEEVCPAFLGNARRLHWGLSDPAGVDGDAETRLNAFRKTRDELVRRLERLMGG